MQATAHHESYYIREIRAGNKSVFDAVFLQHYKKLHAYATTFLKDKDDAEEIVQNVFVRIWEKRAGLKEDGFLKAFLYRAVYNECISSVRRQEVRRKFDAHYTNEMENSNSDLSGEVMANELKRKLYGAINELPEKCAEIFILSRMEQMKYQEIADHLNISIKTVENQIGKALKILRVKLAEYLTLILIYLTIQL